MADKLKSAWKLVRAQLCDMGDGEKHGDDHHDCECHICQTIVEMDAKLNFHPAINF